MLYKNDLMVSQCVQSTPMQVQTLRSPGQLRSVHGKEIAQRNAAVSRSICQQKGGVSGGEQVYWCDRGTLLLMHEVVAQCEFDRPQIGHESMSPVYM